MVKEKDSQTDIWCDDVPLAERYRDLFNLDEKKKAFVAELCNNNQLCFFWNLDF